MFTLAKFCVLSGRIAKRVTTSSALTLAICSLGGAQQPAFASPLDIARDAVVRTVGRLSSARIDEKSSLAALNQLQAVMATPVSDLPSRLFPSTTMEPSDSVRRCSSRNERRSEWCKAVSPRNVLILSRVTRNDDGTVVVWLQGIRWNKPSETAPSSAIWKLRYRKGGDGTWGFDRELAGIAS